MKLPVVRAVFVGIFARACSSAAPPTVGPTPSQVVPESNHWNGCVTDGRNAQSHYLGIQGVLARVIYGATSGNRPSMAEEMRFARGENVCRPPMKSN
jgi:hypothetical protein